MTAIYKNTFVSESMLKTYNFKIQIADDQELIFHSFLKKILINPNYDTKRKYKRGYCIYPHPALSIG
jgi:hypothetical protein